jgi:hypothetical protein
VVAISRWTHLVLPSGLQESAGPWVRWKGDEIDVLGNPMNEISSYIYDVDSDGSTIVGITGSPSRGIKWTEQRGFEYLPVSLTDPPPDDDAEFATGVSPDGTVIWGRRGGAGGRVMRWDGEGPAVFPGEPSGHNDIVDVAYDGTVGGFRFTATPDVPEGPFIYNPESGYTFVPQPAGEYMIAYEVSAGGRYSVGMIEHNGASACFWSKELGVVRLPRDVYPRDVSETGIAVGFYQSLQAAGDNDFLWDQSHGARHLRAILSHAGIQIPKDLTLREVTSISEDGTTVAGIASSKTDPDECIFFRAVLPRNFAEAGAD